MKSSLWITGLMLAGLVVSAAVAGAPDSAARAGDSQRSDVYTDTPLSAEDVREKAVFDEQSNKVGIVRDVLESSRLGPLAIVEVGGPRGEFAKKVAVALDQLVLEPDGRLVALLDSEDLKALPEFPGKSGVNS